MFSRILLWSLQVRALVLGFSRFLPRRTQRLVDDLIGPVMRSRLLASFLDHLRRGLDHLCRVAIALAVAALTSGAVALYLDSSFFIEVAPGTIGYALEVTADEMADLWLGLTGQVPDETPCSPDPSEGDWRGCDDGATGRSQSEGTGPAASPPSLARDSISDGNNQETDETDIGGSLDASEETGPGRTPRVGIEPGDPPSIRIEAIAINSTGEPEEDEPGDDHFADTHLALTMLVGLVFFIVFLVTYYGRWPLIGWSAVVVGAIAMPTVLGQALFDSIAKEYAGTIPLWAAFFVLSLGATPRLLFLAGHGMRKELEAHRSGAFVRSSESPTCLICLPFQQRVVDQLILATFPDSEPAQRPANTVPLRGEWGSGKTTALALFQQQVATKAGADGCGRVAVVNFSAWHHQADSLPEFSLFREIVQDWSVIYPIGWLAVPVVRMSITIILQLFKIVAMIDKAQVSIREEMEGMVPRSLFWQEHLRHLLLVLLKQGGYRRLIIVIDDIDRCHPPAAQRFVTLIRRFLSVDGVSIVIPHVVEQIRYKVFSPPSIVVPDLQSTSMAILAEEFRSELVAFLREVRPARARAGSVPAENPSPRLWEEALYRILAEGGRWVQQQYPHRSWEDPLNDFLVEEFEIADRHVQERIHLLLEDKYLADSVIEMPDITADDFVSLIERTPIVARTVYRFIEGGEGERAEPLPVDWMRRGLPGARESKISLQPMIKDIWNEVLQGESRVPVIRQLNAALNLQFSRINEKNLEAIRRGIYRSPLSDDRAERATRIQVVLLVLYWVVAYASLRVISANAGRGDR